MESVLVKCVYLHCSLTNGNMAKRMSKLASL